jgi:hypothetical protein
MPELPEIRVFARDMRKELVGRRIGGIEVLQPKCLNLPEASSGPDCWAPRSAMSPPMASGCRQRRPGAGCC